MNKATARSAALASDDQVEKGDPEGLHASPRDLVGTAAAPCS
jgi:hypothetical protein